MLVKIWLPIFYHLPHNLTQFLQNQPILPNFAFSTLSVDSSVQFSPFIVGHSQNSQVPHLLSIGRCRQASSDAFNKLRNLSLSHRKIHPKFLKRARLNRHCYDYHDLDRFSDWRMATVASRSPGDFLRLSSIRQRQSFSRPLFSPSFLNIPLSYFLL